MKKIIKLAPLLVLYLLTVQTALSQKSSEKPEQATTANATTSLVESKHFVFVPETVTPIGGPTRPVNGQYDVTISGDTLASNLPYFGRAFSAPVNPSESPLRFTSTSFEYTVKERSKGGWDILIKPARGTNVQQMSLFISDNGFASLQVTSTNRQPITFSGHVDEINRKK